MALTNEIDILIKAEVDKAIKNINKADKATQKFQKNTQKGTKKTEGVFTRLGKNIKGNFLKIGAAVAGSVAVVKKAFDFTKEFAAFKQSSEATKKQFGLDARDVLKELNKISKGTISNSNLILSANKALALGVTDNVGTLAKILEVARVRGQALGLDTKQAFDDLVTGIGRGSPLILDNLGIITKGWAEQAKAQGVVYDKQFILNKVLDDGAKILEKTGEVTLTSAERFQQIGASVDNAKISIGEALLPVIEAILPVFKRFIEGISKAPKAVKLIGVAALAIVPALVALTTAFGPIGLIIAGVSAAVIGLGIAFGDSTDEINKNTEAIDKNEKSLERFKKIKEIEKLYSSLNNLSKDTNERIEQFNNLSKEQQGIIKNAARPFGGYIKALKNTSIFNRLLLKTQRDFLNRFKKTSKAVSLQNTNFKKRNKLIKEAVQLGISDNRIKKLTISQLGQLIKKQKEDNDIKQEIINVVNEIEQVEGKSVDGRIKKIKELLATDLASTEQRKILSKELAQLIEENSDKQIKSLDVLNERLGQFSSIVGDGNKSMAEYKQSTRDAIKSTGGFQAAIVAIIEAIAGVGTAVSNAGESILKFNDETNTLGKAEDEVSGLARAFKAVGGFIAAGKDGIGGFINFFQTELARGEQIVEDFENNIANIIESVAQKQLDIQLKTDLAAIDLKKDALLQQLNAESEYIKLLEAEKQKEFESLTKDQQKKVLLQQEYEAEKAAIEEAAEIEKEERQKEYDLARFNAQKKAWIAEAKGQKQIALTDAERILGKGRRDRAKDDINDRFDSLISDIDALTFYADGGRNIPGGLSVVGERGPELVNLPRGADVYNNNETQQMLNNTISIENITLPNVNNAEQFFEQMQQYKRQYGVLAS